jgi:murein DD-endopeptidase MepM/ murein hydrolase activator NlpD
MNDFLKSGNELKRGSGAASGRPHPVAFAAGLFFLLAGSAYFWLQRSQPYGMPRTAPNSPTAVSSAFASPPLKEISGSFQKNQTITAALTGHGLPADLVLRLVKDCLPAFNLARISANRPYWLYFRPGGEFNDFRYAIDDRRYLTAYKQGDAFVPVIKDFVYETRVESVSGIIEGSLIGSIASKRELEMLALQFADIFMYDIDFYTDLKKGDAYRLLVEKKYGHGRFIKYGSILAAEFQNQGRTLRGFHYTDANGAQAYFAQDGKALKRSFLKSPLKFARVTSRFAGSRLHPILKIFRPHLGVDYAAPVGMPVQAVGSGVVKSAGIQGGSGRMVKLGHPGGYETLYLHLSKIAVKPRDRVSQGDVIGYVGSSGLSTGPHLDFRILQHGNYINPAKVIFPPNPPLAGSALEQFAQIRDSLQLRLNGIDIR